MTHESPNIKHFQFGFWKQNFCFSFQAFKNIQHQSALKNTLGLYNFYCLRQETKILFEKSELMFSSFTWSSLCSGKINLDVHIPSKTCHHQNTTALPNYITSYMQPCTYKTLSQHPTTLGPTSVQHYITTKLSLQYTNT